MIWDRTAGIHLAVALGRAEGNRAKAEDFGLFGVSFDMIALDRAVADAEKRFKEYQDFHTGPIGRVH